MLAQSSSSSSLPSSPFPQNLPTTNSMSSDHEQFVLELFDNLWFNNGVLLSKGSRSISVVVATKDDEDDEPAAGAVPRLSRAPSIIGRSASDQALSLNDNQSDSDSSSTPKSVLAMRPALQTIRSGKEIGEFEQVTTDCSKGCAENRVIEKRNSKSRGGGGRRRRNNGSSRSLSELEYEELKGFMDLGFVFPDEDKDSSLVSIIPGLQRLGRKDNESNSTGTGDNNNNNNNRGVFHYQSSVPRPYLSEAWDVQEMENTLKPLVNWRIPAFGNEMELKDHLKFWAHTVASTVR